MEFQISQALIFSNFPITRAESRSLSSVKYCNSTLDFPNSPIFLSNFHFPWRLKKLGFHCIFFTSDLFHLALIYAVFFFYIKPMQLDRYIINLSYVHENHYCFSLSFSFSLQSFCNTVCIYGHANKASCCCCLTNVILRSHKEIFIAHAFAHSFSLKGYSNFAFVFCFFFFFLRSIKGHAFIAFQTLKPSARELARLASLVLKAGYGLAHFP